MARINVVELPSPDKSLQRALALTEAHRHAAINPQLTTLWDPYACPLDLLPFLAWSLSVDYWDDGWPESVKRDVVAATPDVHRKKGTVDAVRSALAPFGFTVSITEWWHTNPVGRRGTFSVTGFVTAAVYGDQENLLDARMQALARSFIRSSKPKSRVFDFQLGVAAIAKAGVSLAHSAAITDHNDMALYVPSDENCSAIIANSHQAVMLDHAACVIH